MNYHAQVYAKALEVFEDPHKASSWLKGQIPALGGRVPLDLIETKEGAQEVLTELERIRWGIFA